MNRQTIADDFGLDPLQHAWITIPSKGKSRSGKSWWEARDNLAFDLAKTILPISIRPGGRWDRMLGEAGNRLVDNRFKVEYCNKPSAEMKIEIPESCFSCSDWSYVTHWTRRFYGPWPGETSAEFYRAISSSGALYPRSAAHTLERILKVNTLMGSGEHIRKNKPIVAFTSLPPSQAIPLMRWRARYVRPTFEPYGIAIHLRSAHALGIRPVTYVKSDEKHDPVDENFTQGYGTGDWPAEAEWRAIGDIDLGKILPDDVLVLVPSRLHAERFREITGFRVHPLTEAF